MLGRAWNGVRGPVFMITSAEPAEGVSTLGVINPGFKVCRLCKNIQNSLTLQPSTRVYTCTPHADRNKNILFKL